MLGIRVSVQVRLVGFRVDRIRLGTEHFSDRIGSDNIGFRLGFYLFLQNPKHNRIINDSGLKPKKH